MKTALDAIQDLYNLLNVSEVQTLLNGGRVYKLARPMASVKKDVVINSLAITNTQFQKGVLNVNIHAPNLKNLVIDGVADNTQPDLVSLKAIAAAVIEIAEANYQNDFHCDCDNGGVIIRDTDGTYYVNVRINYYSFTKDFQNI